MADFGIGHADDRLKTGKKAPGRFPPHKQTLVTDRKHELKQERLS